MFTKIRGGAVAGILVVVILIWFAMIYTDPINGTILEHLAIYSEDDFVSYGFSGNGSSSNPYVVENITIPNPPSGQ